MTSSLCLSHSAWYKQTGPTMKKALKTLLSGAFILSFALFVFFLAKQNRASLEATLPIAARTVAVNAFSEGESVGRQENEQAAPRARINLLWDEVLLDTLDMNLDEDLELEQVLTVREHASQEGRISVVIADFSASTGSYFRLWKGESLATKPNAFIVQPRDMLGEGSIDLLCFGLDEKNFQTLTIFKRFPLQAGAFYRSIFEESGLSVRVEEDGPTPLLVRLFKSAESEDSPLDQKMTSFGWNPFSKNYERLSELLIPGESVEKSFVDSLLTGDPSRFESYLSGLWKKESSSEDEPTLVYFDPESRKVSIHSKTEKQIWDWGRSNPSSAGIYSSIVNSGVPDIIRLMGVDLLGKDKVRIQATSNQIVKFVIREDWNGSYTRVSGRQAAQKRILQSLAGEAFIELPIVDSQELLSIGSDELEGDFEAQGSYVLRLDKGRLSYREGELNYEGRYGFFASGTDVVLDLDLVDSRSLPAGRRSFLVFIKPGQNGNWSLVLRSAKLLAERVEPLYTPDLVFSKSSENQGRR